MRENMEEINKTTWPNANASFNYDFLRNTIQLATIIGL